jgi:uncharacterized membrane protein YkvI
MLNNFLDILKISGVYTSLILGAGFASGQEILIFFMRHKSLGFIGLIISGIIFGGIGYFVLDIAHKFKITSSKDFFKLILKDYSKIFELLINLFMLVLYITMLSATGAFFNQEYNLNYSFGIIIMSLICFIIHELGINFFAKLNLILMPVLFFGELIICLYIILNRESQHVFNSSNFLFIRDSIIYASYNIITGVCLLISLIKISKNKSLSKFGAILGSIFITMLGIIISLVIFYCYKFSSSCEIPMLSITHNFNSLIQASYSIIFFLAIFTTAMGNYFAICESLNSKANSKKNFYIKILISLLSIIFAHIKFSRLVSKIYPVFSYLGLFLIILITLFYFLYTRLK